MATRYVVHSIADIYSNCSGNKSMIFVDISPEGCRILCISSSPSFPPSLPPPLFSRGVVTFRFSLYTHICLLFAVQLPSLFLHLFIYLPFLAPSFLSLRFHLFRDDFLSSLRRPRDVFPLIQKRRDSGEDKRGRKRVPSVTLGAGERRKYTRAWRLVSLLFAGANGPPRRAAPRSRASRVARAVATNFPSFSTARRRAGLEDSRLRREIGVVRFHLGEQSVTGMRELPRGIVRPRTLFSPKLVQG